MSANAPNNKLLALVATSDSTATVHPVQGYKHLYSQGSDKMLPLRCFMIFTPSQTPTTTDAINVISY